MGAKVCKSISGRGSEAEDVCVANCRTLQTQSSALPMNEKETLHWLNNLLAGLWPKVNAAVIKMVHESIEPSIQEKMPYGFKDTHFKKFTLGTKTPELGPIAVIQSKECVKIVLGVNYQSDVDIEITTKVASVGIKSIHLKGDFMIHLSPLLEELPVVGGICAYFLDPPDVDLDFTGLGNVADCPGIAGTIRGVIDSTIAGICVLPNTIAVPVGTADQGVDPALLKLPEPIGVLRFRPLRARDLIGKDSHLMSAATSDPYVKVKIADDAWQSSVIKSNLNPEWGEDDFHDFVVFDRDQSVRIEVWDDDSMTGDDFIGRAKTCKVGEILALCSQPLPLTDGTEDKEIPAGSLDLKLEWLEFTKEKAEGDSCVIAVKIESIVLPAGMDPVALAPAIQGQLRSLTKVSPAGVPPTKPTLPAVTKALQGVAKRCKAQGMSDEEAAEVVGVTQEDLKAMLDDETEKKEQEAGVSKTAQSILDVNTVLYLDTTTSGLKSEELTLLLVDKKKKELGRATVQMGDVLSTKGLAKPGPVFFSLADSLKLQGERVEADIQVSVFGLRSVQVAQAAAAEAPVTAE
eukprot:TRINITY_DN44751_c0_g1_i1.p1 TRINITY_DN44751_c0_g1~~TRINITY_DN44751_c0_g1_i1.p1  ORF type:complete len:574 (+),score=104.69 TRINITY_DN44751_c0_g1_i1:34-1755(+)